MRSTCTHGPSFPPVSGFAAAVALGAAATLAAPAYSQGCAPDTACTYEMKIGDRTAWVHVPAAYYRHKSAGERVALLLDLHGRNLKGREKTQSGIQMKASGQLVQSDRRGFIAVWPQATFQQSKDQLTSDGAQSWNAFTCCGPAYPKTADDAFMKEIINRIKDSYAIDANRVYMTGVSNGGSMAIRMACAGTEIKAIAPVSAAVYRISDNKNCPRTDIPVMEFRSKEDKVVEYDGGTFESADTGLTRWLTANHCAERPANLTHIGVGAGPAYEQRSKTCKDHVLTSLVTLPDSGHVPYGASSGVDIACYMWAHIFKQDAPGGAAQDTSCLKPRTAAASDQPGTSDTKL